MRIVIDANVLFSAMCKDGMTRHILLEEDNTFLFPKYMIEEYDKYKDILRKKSKLNIQEFELLFNLILTSLQKVPMSVLEPFIEEAKIIIDKIDPKDMFFVAATLAYPDAILWSDDKKLKMQDDVTVLNSRDIIGLLKGGHKL